MIVRVILGNPLAAKDATWAWVCVRPGPLLRSGVLSTRGNDISHQTLALLISLDILRPALPPNGSKSGHHLRVSDIHTKAPHPDMVFG